MVYSRKAPRKTGKDGNDVGVIETGKRSAPNQGMEIPEGKNVPGQHAIKGRYKNEGQTCDENHKKCDAAHLRPTFVAGRRGPALFGSVNALPSYHASSGAQPAPQQAHD